MASGAQYYTPPEEQDLGDFYKAYGVTREREDISDFFKENGFQKSPFGYVPPNPTGAGVAGATANYAQIAKKNYKKGLGMMPDLPGIDGIMSKYREQYAGVDDAFDVSDTVRAGNEARGYSRNVAVDAANTAAQEYGSSQGGNATGAALIRAKALIPAMQSDTGVALQLAQIKDDSRREAMSMSKSITDSMASLKGNYINTLASYNASKASNALGYADMVTTNRKYTDATDNDEQNDWYNRIMSLMPTLGGVPANQIT